MQITDENWKVEKEGKMKVAAVSITNDEKMPVVHDTEGSRETRDCSLQCRKRKAADGGIMMTSLIRSIRDTRERIQHLIQKIPQRQWLPDSQYGKKPDKLPRKNEMLRFYGKVCSAFVIRAGSGSGAENSCKIRKLR